MIIRKYKTQLFTSKEPKSSGRSHKKVRGKPSGYGPPCMAVSVIVQYNGGLLPDIIMLTQCYCHRGTRLNTIKRFCFYSL